MKLQKRCLFFFILIVVVKVSYAQYKTEDWKERDTWMNVSKIFEFAQIKSGSAVADIGCHEGYLTIHLAEKVEESGKVYAVDVRQDRLDTLDEYIKDHKFKNIKTILGDYDNPKLPKELLDVVIIMDTYHEMDDYIIILEHIKQSLKPGGRILILEKLKKHMRNKSREEQVDAHTLSLGYVKKELQEAGFSISKEISDFGKWEKESDKTMWILVGVLP